jgi:hypothetical protein
MLEVTQASISVWGADSVGARIAPSGTYGSMSGSDRAATFGYLTTKLGRLGIAYLHVVKSRIKGTEEVPHGRSPIAAQPLRPKFSRTLIAAWRLHPGFRRSHRHLRRRRSRSLWSPLHPQSGSAGAVAQGLAAHSLDRRPRQAIGYRYAPPGRNRSRYGAHDRNVLQDLLFRERIGRFAFDRKCEPFQISTHGIPAG